MGIYSIKPAFRKRLEGTRDVLIRRGVSANSLTSTALLLSLLAGAAIAASEVYPALLLAVPALAMVRITLNALDGMVAVHSGTATRSGEFFNEMADRLADSAFFAGLALVADPGPALVALVVVLLSSYVGVLGKAAGGERNYGGIFGKADRMIFLSVASLAAFASGPQWLDRFSMAAIPLGLVTLIQRTVSTMTQLKSDAT